MPGLARQDLPSARAYEQAVVIGPYVPTPPYAPFFGPLLLLLSALESPLLKDETCTQDCDRPMRSLGLAHCPVRSVINKRLER